jgi:hypothetical protein
MNVKNTWTEETFAMSKQDYLYQVGREEEELVACMD